MFGISAPELMMVLVVMLIFLGPKRLPDAARTLGKLVGELRKTAEGVRREMNNALYPPAEIPRASSQLPNQTPITTGSQRANTDEATSTANAEGISVSGKNDTPLSAPEELLSALSGSPATLSTGTLSTENTDNKTSTAQNE